MVGRPYGAIGQEGVLGTDRLGRDVAAMLLYGARTSLLIGFVATMAALVLGVFIGAVSGYSRGWIDSVLTRFTEIFQTIPAFLLAIVLIVLMGASVQTMVVAIAVVSWPPVARLVRGEFLTLTQREFVQSCRLLGMPARNIILFEILPNTLGPIAVISSVIVANAILMEAALSFLGLGDPNFASWGQMIAEARPAIRTAAYLSVIPGLAILFTVLAVNSVAEAVTRLANPRSRVG